MPEKAVEGGMPTGYRLRSSLAVPLVVSGSLLKLEEQLRRTVGAFRELGRWFRGSSARTALIKAKTQRKLLKTTVWVRPERANLAAGLRGRRPRHPPEAVVRGVVMEEPTFRVPVVWHRFRGVGRRCATAALRRLTRVLQPRAVERSAQPSQLSAAVALALDHSSLIATLALLRQQKVVVGGQADDDRRLRIKLGIWRLAK
jgi:hypothetical protein